MGTSGHCPFENELGAAMSSPPWERLWRGDEDVAAPFWMGEESRIAHGK